MADWGAELWDQFDAVNGHMECQIEWVKRLQTFVKERSRVEADYAKDLRKVLKHFQREKDTKGCRGTAYSAFHKILAETDDVAGQHEVVAEQWVGLITEQLKKLAQDQAKEKRQIQAEGVKCQNAYKDAIAQLDKMRRKYEDATKDCEKAISNFDKANIDMNLTKAQVEKIRQTMESKKKAAEDAKTNYIITLENTNTFQRDHFYERMPSVFKSLQKLDESRTATLAHLFSKFHDINVGVTPIISKCWQNIAAAAQSVEPQTDAERVVDSHKTGYLPPDNFTLDGQPQERNQRLSVKSKAGGKEKEDFSHLPPAKQKKRLQAKIKEIDDAIRKEQAEITALEKMRQVYSANPSLGDPVVVEQQLLQHNETLEKLNQSKIKFEGYLNNAATNGKGEPIYAVSAKEQSLLDSDPPPSLPSPATELTSPGPENWEEDFSDDVLRCQVLYDFPGTNEGEIGVSSGESVELVENDESGWIRVRKQDGKEGYIPLTYAQL